MIIDKYRLDEWEKCKDYEVKLEWDERWLRNGWKNVSSNWGNK
jgi:hypothetical protein